MIGLKLGDTGEDVKGLQEMLRRAGFPADAVSGTYDQSTADAVLACRRSVDPSVTIGTPITGAAYEQILVAFILKNAQGKVVEVIKEVPVEMADRSFPKLGDTGEEVGYYQRLLGYAGFPLPRNNTYDEVMRARLAEWYASISDDNYSGDTITSMVSIKLQSYAYGRA